MKICDNTRLPPCCWTCQPKLENEELFIEELSGLEDIQQRNKAFRNTQKNRHKDQCKTTERTRVSLTSRCKKNKHRSVQSSPRHKVVEDCYQSIKPHINEFNQTKTVRVTHFNQPQNQIKTQDGQHQQSSPHQWEIKDAVSKIITEKQHFQNKSTIEKQHLFLQYKIQKQFHNNRPQNQNLTIYNPQNHGLDRDMMNQNEIVGAKEPWKAGDKIQSIFQNSFTNTVRPIKKLREEPDEIQQKKSNCLNGQAQKNLRRSLRRQTVSSFTSEQQHQLKIEESQVLIDFFNPPQMMLEILHKNLHQVPY